MPTTSRGNALGLRVVPAVAAALVAVVGRTLRLEVRGLDGVAPLWHARRSVIYAMWHGRILMAPWLNARLRHAAGARRVTVLASRSRDGELVARYAERFGLAAVRGSSSRGGAAALRALAALVRDGEDVVVVPDGPRGPAHRVQPGVVALASLTGAPIVPLAFAARPAVSLRTWDRFLVPVPFARAAAVLGAPITVGEDEHRDRLTAAIARALDDTTRRAEALVG